jgi:hypothetical protein
MRRRPFRACRRLDAGGRSWAVSRAGLRSVCVEGATYTSADRLSSTGRDDVPRSAVLARSRLLAWAAVVAAAAAVLAVVAEVIR